ncbi:PaNAT1 arylamine N-acetyltransferase encoded by the PaNAT1 protein [Cladorrhinum samala]|uniref:PaNAT1 arylamine N-acetyltransferase encoded by the PaNAT1 protein n=1 Tax=Cladorrhinum samala TaxID=585594 RepID=A0AAV9HSP0_9PEZI|nr:PaNAT1 arylamine N-acetyltransferase encoded by the PaNAT1 protein [Cladorrhinum samala]
MDSAYSPEQISQYLAHVGLPQSFHPSSSPTLDINYLTTLFVHQITTFPYENLSIHYSPDHAIVLDPQALFHKMVTSNRGRGGYCMEVSILFHHVLRAVGFSPHMTGVRIRPRINNIPQGQTYSGFVHLVNIVALRDDQKYALDVGFGGDGPTFPMPLIPEVVHRNSIGTQEVRYARDFIPNQRFQDESLGAMKNWIYQYRNRPDQDWNSYYAFNDSYEFFEQDFAILSYFLSRSPDQSQTNTVLAIRFLRGFGDGDGKPKVVGKVMMSNADVKQNLTGKTNLVKVCRTEEERVEILRELFGIQLTEEEAGAIKGCRCELKGDEVLN